MSLKPFVLERELPCTWRPQAECKGCSIEGRLQCRFNWRDFLRFFLIFLPFFAAAIAGEIRSGYGWCLWLWLGYSLFFFFVWEAAVLCRHCPYWAEPSRILRCHANYGVLKIWRYRPGPMCLAEKIQFIVGVLLLMGFPFPGLILGHEYLLALVCGCGAVSAGFLLWNDVCARCVNFSCPLNAVPRELVDAYLERNAAMRAAWEAQGYRVGARPRQNGGASSD